jgi:hypothetical protein
MLLLLLLLPGCFIQLVPVLLLLLLNKGLCRFPGCCHSGRRIRLH